MGTRSGGACGVSLERSCSADGSNLDAKVRMNVHLGFWLRTGEGTVMVEVLQIETPSLGDRSYLVHDGTVALVIDPQRDIDRVTWLAAEYSVRITHVAETHVHNDY